MEAASRKAMRTTLAGSMMPLEHVAALISLNVIAECRGSLVHDLADHAQALNAFILRDLADWRLQCLAHDVDAGVQILIVALDRYCLGGHQQHDAAGRSNLPRPTAWVAAPRSCRQPPGSAPGFAARLGSAVGELFDVLGDVSRLIGRPVSQPAELVGILVDVCGGPTAP